MDLVFRQQSDSPVKPAVLPFVDREFQPGPTDTGFGHGRHVDFRRVPILPAPIATSPLPADDLGESFPTEIGGRHGTLRLDARRPQHHGTHPGDARMSHGPTRPSPAATRPIPSTRYAGSSIHWSANPSRIRSSAPARPVFFRRSRS